MAENRNYTIGTSRIKRACIDGFQRTVDGGLELMQGSRHTAFFGRLNSMEQDTVWGRFYMRADFPANCICIVRALARNEEAIEDGRTLDTYLGDGQIPAEEKKQLLEDYGCEKYVSKTADSGNLLLYRQKGQYLWLGIEVIGEGCGVIDGLKVANPGDNFMRTFPNIYQEEGGFFHRYLSIFSSIYGDLQTHIEGAAEYLDLDRAPGGLLQVYAQWLGIDIQGEFLEEATLRRLLKSAYGLNRIKGTKKALQELIYLLTGEQAVIVERGLMNPFIFKEDRQLYDSLYGNGEQDVTILMNCPAEEKLHAQLLFLIKQFKPVRCRVKLVFYGECSRMDTYCFMDMNARLYDVSHAVLDGGKLLDETVLG